MKNDGVFHHWHHYDEIVDDISIGCVPRYKTSGLSGDEWRVSYRVTIKRKGTTLFERDYTSMRSAITHLPWVMATMYEGGCDGFNEKAWSERITKDKDTCAQPGCDKPMTVRYRLKREFAKDGQGPLPRSGFTIVTGFCEEHSERGNCGREDADANYERISGEVKPAPASSRKPSGFGGFVPMKKAKKTK